MAGTEPRADRGDHLCHLEGCWKRIPRRWIFCRSHWTLVPQPLQALIGYEWRRGRCCRVYHVADDFFLALVSRAADIVQQVLRELG